MPDSEAWETDRVHAFCVHGLGHDMVETVDNGHQEGLQCQRCGTDLSSPLPGRVRRD